MWIYLRHLAIWIVGGAGSNRRTGDIKGTYLVDTSGTETPTISICPLMGRPKVCPEAPKKTPAEKKKQKIG